MIARLYARRLCHRSMRHFEQVYRDMDPADLNEDLVDEVSTEYGVPRGSVSSAAMLALKWKEAVTDPRWATLSYSAKLVLLTIICRSDASGQWEATDDELFAAASTTEAWLVRHYLVRSPA